MNAVTLVKLDGQRFVCGVRNRLESEDVRSRLGATLSIVWMLVVGTAFLAIVLRGGGTSAPSVAAVASELNLRGAAVMLIAILWSDATRRGRSRRRAVFDSWLMSSGVHESTLRGRTAIVSVARSAALAWLPIATVRQTLSPSLSIAEAFVWSFGTVCVGESVGQAWNGWPRPFWVVWAFLIVSVWFLGVAVLFRFVDEGLLLSNPSHPLALASLYAVAGLALTRPLVHREATSAPPEASRRPAGISVPGRLRGLLARDARVLATFAHRDWLLALFVTFLAALPQGRLGEMTSDAISEAVRSPGGAFLTLIQAALVGCVVGEVLWEGDRPNTWAFYRSAGAHLHVLLGRTILAIASAALWYAIVTAPTSVLAGTASFDKHALGVAAICGIGGVSSLGGVLGAVLGSTPAQARAFRMAGVTGVAGLFFRLSSVTPLLQALTAGALLVCCFGATVALLSRGDLGLRRL